MRKTLRSIVLSGALLASPLIASCQTGGTAPPTPEPEPEPTTECAVGTAQEEAERLGMPGWVVSGYDTNEDDGGGCFTVHEEVATQNLASIHADGLVAPVTLERVVTKYGGAGPLNANAIMMTYEGWLADRQELLDAGRDVPDFFSHDILAVVDPGGFIGESGLPSRVDPSATIFDRNEFILNLLLPDWIQGEENASYLELFDETECFVNLESGDIQSSFDLRLNPDLRVGEDVDYRNGFAGELRLEYRLIRPRTTAWGEQYDSAEFRLVHDVHPDDRSLIDLPKVSAIVVHGAPNSYDTSIAMEDLPSIGSTYDLGESLGVRVQRYNPLGQIADVTIAPGNISEGGWIDIGVGPGMYDGGELSVRAIDPFAWKYYPEGLQFAPKRIDRQLEPSSYVMDCD